MRVIEGLFFRSTLRKGAVAILLILYGQEKNLWFCCFLHEILEVERAMAQLYFWLELGELSQLGSAQLAILNLLASSAQLSS